MKQKQNTVALITGSSTGIGYATSLMLARNGFYTYASMRDIGKSTSIIQIAKKEALPLEVIQLDVNDDLSVKKAIEKIISGKGRIDILVNNAGYGLIGPIEDILLEELKAQFETNLFGVIRVTQQVLPIMREQKEEGESRIINVSSIGGIVGYPFSGAYCSTKFALEGLSESMSYEVEQFGIRVILIEPALVISNFHNNTKIVAKSDRTDSPYLQTMNKLFEAYEKVVEEYHIPAEEVAKVILNAAISNNPDRRYLVGKYSKMMMEAKKNMSDLECHYMVKRQLLSGE